MKRTYRGRSLGSYTVGVIAILATVGQGALATDETPSRNRSMLGGGTSYYETSDDYRYLEVFANYRNNRREMYWPYQESDSTSTDWGFDTAFRTGSLGTSDFRAFQVGALAAKRFDTGGYLEGGVGVHALRGDREVGDRTIPTYSVKGRLGLGDTADIGLDAYYDLLYPEGFQPASLTDALTGHTIVGSLALRPTTRLSVQSLSYVRLISDSNRMYTTDLSVLYGFSPDWPWIWAGAGIYYQVFETQTDGYWSPPQYLSYGPRVDASFPITSRLNAWAGVNLSVVSEDEFVSEFGDYVSAGLDYTFGKDTHLKFEITRLDSVRDGSHYYENGAVLSLHRPLF